MEKLEECLPRKSFIIFKPLLYKFIFLDKVLSIVPYASEIFFKKFVSDNFNDKAA